MKNIEIQFKEFNLNLEKVLEQAKVLAPDLISGLSADVNIRIHCADEISEEQIAAIQAYVDGLNEESEEAASYRSAEQIEAAKKAIKEAILAKDWNSMSALERGMVIGKEPTAAELIAANLL